MDENEKVTLFAVGDTQDDAAESGRFFDERDDAIMYATQHDYSLVYEVPVTAHWGECGTTWDNPNKI